CVCVCVCVSESKGGWSASLRQRGGARESTGGCGKEREQAYSDFTTLQAPIPLTHFTLLQPPISSMEARHALLLCAYCLPPCAELQGFIRPLLELLNGLKRGRFDRGLSSFQQSVAMDRIQRIVGVLQRPDCGEKYLNTLLQVEMMLKLWFPQIPTQPVSTASSVATSPARSLQEASGSTPPHKHRDQLHIPVKEPGKVSKYQAGQSSKPSLTWVHVAPILSPRNTCLSHDALTASRRGSPATQDSSISSTTPYKHPKNLKKPIRCQSQPVAGQQSERGTTETTPGESQSPPVTLKPLPGACPTSLKT
uniref:Uncharacterized LOC102790795 n=1 Tax=Neolamprologus brichardi TaxID=32507 RepID=A0A3Q4G7T3_NEOBR